MATSFLDQLLVDFLNWTKTIEDCRALLLFGSTARGDGDHYSDHDIQVIVNNIDNEAYINWMQTMHRSRYSS